MEVGSQAKQRLLAIITDPLVAPEPIDELRRRAIAAGVGVHVVAPAVEGSAFQHTLGDVDGPAWEAEGRLEASLAALRRGGVDATGTVGDPDPVLAAEDALRQAPAAEVLIFERAEDQARWFEHGLFERAREQLEPPLRLVLIHDDGDGAGEHVVGVSQADAGIASSRENEITVSQNLPYFSPRDLAGMVVGVVGTIATVVLAAAGPGPGSGWGAVSILVAIGIALINMAHVVGLTLFESVRYRGGWETFFRTVALIATPAAVAVNLLILLLA